MTLQRDNAIAQITSLQENHNETTELLHGQINDLSEQLEIANSTANDINTQLLADRRMSRRWYLDSMIVRLVSDY